VNGYLVTAEQSDPTVSSAEWHDKLSSRLESHAAELYEQLLEVYRLHQACHDARLDIYNVLRSGNREEAMSIATAFACPDDRDRQSPTF
jgi:hypothetical protein